MILYQLILICMPLIYSISLVMLSIFNNTDYLFILLNYCIFGNFLNKIEKKIFKSIQGKDNIIGKRPNPLGTKFLKNKYDKCSIPINLKNPLKLKLVNKNYFKNKKHIPSWGFPSGHAQETSFFSTFLTIYLININNRYKNIIIPLLWIINILVIYQRVYAGCHTILQVIVGDIFGITYGVISYYICYKLYPNKFPISN